MVEVYREMSHAALEHIQKFSPNHFAQGLIYHPHPTVRDVFLNQAIWVDPADFNFNIEDTINFALSQDINYYREINHVWLESDVLKLTTPDAYYHKVYNIMQAKLLKTGYNLAISSE